jgi:hypothetical protein
MLLVPCLIASRVTAGSGKEKTPVFGHKTLPANHPSAQDFLTTL